MAGGFKAPAKRIGFWHRTSDVTAERRTLLAAVRWALQPLDAARSMTAKHCWAVGACLTLLGCGGTGQGTAVLIVADAAPPDAPVPADAALPDAPTPDAPVVPDAAVADWPAPPDAPVPDVAPDRALPDAPVPDAPEPDAPTPDAPVPDAPAADSAWTPASSGRTPPARSRRCGRRSCPSICT